MYPACFGLEVVHVDGRRGGWKPVLMIGGLLAVGLVFTFNCFMSVRDWEPSRRRGPLVDIEGLIESGALERIDGDRSGDSDDVRMDG